MKIKLCTIDIGAKLLPGIKEAIGRYQADGWHIVIISTQGRAVISTDVRIGDYVPHGADLYRVEKIDRDKWGVIFKYDKYKGGSQFEWFDLNDEVLIQCKTVESAIEEITTFADLCGIEEAYLCPDSLRQTCISIEKTTENPEWKWRLVPNENMNAWNYRQPSEGMQSIAEFYMLIRTNQPDILDVLMVADMEDEEGWETTGFKFMSAKEFGNG